MRTFTPTGRSPLVSHEVVPEHDLSYLWQTGTTRNRYIRYVRGFVLVLVPIHQPKGRERSLSIQRWPRKWTPVDLYCGGIEHAILHLLYARFFTKVLRDLGLIEHSEPFVRLRNQGMILAEEGTKMSKSRGTQVSPDELVQQYGADSLRLHLMYLGPWDQGGPWNTRGITGMERFIRRVYGLVLETSRVRAEQIRRSRIGPQARTAGSTRRCNA